VRALKYHGGVAVSDLDRENLTALEAGCVNLARHLGNIREHYGLPCVVSINHFTHDTPAELELLTRRVEALGARAVVARHWAEGGAGAEDLARAVLAVIDGAGAAHRHVYPDEAPLWDKIAAVATRIYGAAGIAAPARVRQQLAEFDARYPGFPVCIAKTQMSFSTDPAARGAPSGHTVEIGEVKVAAGAGFVVAIAGNMMTMPGLPRIPAAEKIDVDEHGRIVGLF
jgi:formate--tetrahydrofolate ligase